MGRQCRGNAERLGEIGEEGELSRARRMGTIHRCHIDLRGEFLVVADACSDFGGRGWMSKLVVEEATYLSLANTAEAKREPPNGSLCFLCFNIQRRARAFG